MTDDMKLSTEIELLARKLHDEWVEDKVEKLIADRLDKQISTKISSWEKAIKLFIGALTFIGTGVLASGLIGAVWSVTSSKDLNKELYAKLNFIQKNALESLKNTEDTFKARFDERVADHTFITRITKLAEDAV